MVRVNARGVGDLKVNSRDDRFSLAIKDQICKASGPWSEMKELVPMLSAVSISIQDPEKGFKAVYIIASDSLVFQDGESQFFYGKIDKKVWREIWDLAAGEADRLKR